MAWHANLAIAQLAVRAQEALVVVLGKEHHALASLSLQTCGFAVVHIVHSLHRLIRANWCTAVASVAVEVVVFLSIAQLAMHVNQVITRVAAFTLASDLWLPVRNVFALAMFAIARGAHRALGVGVEHVAFLAVDTWLACRKVALRPQKALVVLPEVHEATTLVIGLAHRSTSLDAVHVRLMSIPRSPPGASMTFIAVRVSVLLVAEDTSASLAAEICIGALQEAGRICVASPTKTPVRCI